MAAPSKLRLGLTGSAEVPRDALDVRVRATVQGSWLGRFLGELLQGSGLLALLLLLLEAIGEWDSLWHRPDVYVLMTVAVGQSAWLAWRLRGDASLGWWNRALGLLLYAVVESWLEGPEFFAQTRHITFAVLTLLYAAGMDLETRATLHGFQWLGLAVARSAQGLAPVLFYVALDLRDQGWLQGWQEFLQSPAHVYLIALGVTQAAALTTLALVSRRQSGVILDLVEQLKRLSRWGFGSRVVQAVLGGQADAQAAARTERAIVFVDVRGFTAWSETHDPEAVIALLSSFYEAVFKAAGSALVKSKMSGDEVLLVLPSDPVQALRCAQEALRAALAAVQPFGLSAGAGGWIGPVVEGFFGIQDSPVHDVIGDTVNTAKRLCDQASGGQLLVGPGELFATQMPHLPAVTLQAKGKQLPLQAVRWECSDVTLPA